MKNFIVQALSVKRKGKTVPPSKRLLYAVYISIATLAALTTLEAVHVAVLKAWNNEVFAVISGLVGNLTGIFLSHKL